MILFEAGDATRRFFFDRERGTLALMAKQGSRVKEVWRATLVGRSDKSTISGTGTLDAILGRNHRWVLGGTSVCEIQKWLNKKTAYAAYVFDPIGSVLLSWLYLPDGRYPQEGKPYDYRGSPLRGPGVGEPYPITDEERRYLADRKFSG